MSRGTEGPAAEDRPHIQMASPSKMFATSPSAKKHVFVREVDVGDAGW